LPGPWITTDDLTLALSFSLKIPVVSINASAFWPGIIAESIQTASDIITSKLLGRGYLDSQIDTWDRRVEFNKDLGRYWAFIRGNAANTYNDALIKAFDRTKELDIVAVMSNGILLLPLGGDAGPGVPNTQNNYIDGGGAASGGRMNEEFFTIRRCTRF
jgi:hypothetical protein